MTAGANGSGPGTTQFNVAANTGGSRTGTLTIAGETFTVTQAAGPVCTFRLNPTSETFDEDGGTDDVQVQAPSGCAWTAKSTEKWIQITSGASGTGDGLVRYRVEPHKGKGTRTGEMIIAGQTFTVTQRGDDE